MCDDKWFHLRDPNKLNQWLSLGQLAQPVVKCKSLETEVILCVWWNYEGVFYSGLVSEGRAINFELYCEQLGSNVLYSFYIPDLVPSDFHLFRSMAHFLSGRIFDSIVDVEQGCREFFDTKSKDWYLK